MDYISQPNYDFFLNYLFLMNFSNNSLIYLNQLIVSNTFKAKLFICLTDLRIQENCSNVDLDLKTQPYNYEKEQTFRMMKALSKIESYWKMKEKLYAGLIVSICSFVQI